LVSSKLNGQDISKFFDVKLLDGIITRTIEAVEKSKEQIFEISEQARLECERVKREAAELQGQVNEVIKQVDELEKKEKLARMRLMGVSRDFARYSEHDIKAAYETAHRFQLELFRFRAQEKHLREKRDELERSLRKLEEMVRKAEGLVPQVGMVLKLLSGDLKDLSEKIGGIQQIQQLGYKIIKAQEEERRRVAREIHDGPAQAMANIVMRAEVCERMLQIKPEQVAEELQELKKLIRESLQDLRKVIFDLRPMALDDLGVVPTLRRYIADFQEKNKLVIEFFFRGRDQRFASSLEAAIFRTVQEAITNIKKHAQACKVTVELEFAKDKVYLMIKDNGRGFNLEQVLGDLNRESYGLVSMKERIELLEGQISITSSLDKGTEIRTIIPIKE
jgi:two-component system sensor histidine kinase DegS